MRKIVIEGDVCEFLNNNGILPGKNGKFKKDNEPIELVGYYCALEKHPADQMQNAWQAFKLRESTCVALFDIDDVWY